MQAGGLAVSDVEHFFGNPHLAREVLAGKRPISRGEAKELGNFFRVPPKLFQ
jgi:antitoxin component HigA of HigAB toxin-antitoxin module